MKLNWSLVNKSTMQNIISILTLPYVTFNTICHIDKGIELAQSNINPYVIKAKGDINNILNQGKDSPVEKYLDKRKLASNRRIIDMHYTTLVRYRYIYRAFYDLNNPSGTNLKEAMNVGYVNWMWALDRSTITQNGIIHKGYIRVQKP
jgi:hypothetical protein